MVAPSGLLDHDCYHDCDMCGDSSWTVNGRRQWSIVTLSLFRRKPKITTQYLCNKCAGTKTFLFMHDGQMKINEPRSEETTWHSTVLDLVEKAERERLERVENAEKVRQAVMTVEVELDSSGKVKGKGKKR